MILILGWTLLDQACRDCYTPLMRSPPPDRRLFCVRCNRDTTLPNGVPASPSTAPSEILPPSSYRPVVNGDQMDSDEEEGEAGVMEDDPTAPAAQASAIDCFTPTLDILMSVNRREQSDRASKLIGEKLLQGYCLLDEVCPTSTCFGVCKYLLMSN